MNAPTIAHPDVRPPELTSANPVTSATRIQSIDLLRGLVIILMTLDHVRDYFHADAFLFDPLDLDQTTPLQFMTRWVTHFCAPVFVFLAGTSAYLVGVRKGSAALSSFLLKRGLWLVFLEFTVMNIGWFFNFSFPLLVFQVIGALGIGMIALAIVSKLPVKVILFAAILIIVGHNLLDSVHVAGNGPMAILWAWIHEFNGFRIGNMVLLLGYPVLPWTGIMMLGYCFGQLYTADFSLEKRKTFLWKTGAGMILLFVLIRLFNSYGNPSEWKVMESPVYSFLSFINVTKYPPSLLYVLITLGPAFIALAFFEHTRAGWSKVVITLGRAPMLYYILHVYLIHLLALAAAVLSGYKASDMVFDTWITNSENLKGYGFNLAIVYLIWIAVVLMLLPVCVRYDRYKREHKEKWWLSYL